MQRVTARLVAGLMAALLSLLSGQSTADGGGPSLAERVIWAVNAGGESHVDVHGIHFKKDPLEGKIGKGEPCYQRLSLGVSVCDAGLHLDEIDTGVQLVPLVAWQSRAANV